MIEISYAIESPDRVKHSCLLLLDSQSRNRHAEKSEFVLLVVGGKGVLV